MHGSRTGLKTIVRTITADMLAAGVAAETIMTTFENCILDHPARLAYDPRNVLTGKTHSVVLVELTHACAAEVIGNAEVVVLAGIGAAVAQSPEGSRRWNRSGAHDHAPARTTPGRGCRTRE
jgi:hypothetical protein